MDCGQCGTGNRDGARFCRGCGQALARVCVSCGAELVPDSQFCDGCGSPVDAVAPAAAPAAAPSAVRKTVTVLFADLGGSTGFGERSDAEVSRQVLAQYHALLQSVIDAHAGTVAKFMGDGMMATFGIPEVAEDDARRAVDAGAAMQQRFHEFAGEIERRYDETLTLRVGINTGEVVIGAGDADLIGDALNVAARLEKACRPGHVLVGEETWRLTRGEVGYQELGEVTVAGRAQPVAIYELALETDATPDVATPFVGRDAEMQRLVDVFDDARGASKARLVTVLGSPGVGKTRLSRELCSYLAEHADAQRVEIRCDRAGEATFAPVAQLIRDAAGLGEDSDADAARAAIGTLLPATEADHARVVDVLAALVGAGPARSVEETFWGVRRLIEATAADRPLVVVIDDIQWAEPLLLDLIEHLAEWVADAAVLLVGLARPELREVRPSLAEPGRPVSAVVVLDGLDASATEALAAGLLGTDRLPAGLVERLPSSTDGNPLFVRELVRMLVDDRVIRQRGDGAWELTIDAEAVDVPPTIQSLLGARVERLPAAERELLEQAAVVGAEFSLGALRELAGARAPIVPMLEAMRRKELVEPTGTYWGDEPVYRFHHVLIRDAAYRRLLKTTRADLHERVAAWTDRTAADLIGEHETAIAFHYEQAYRYRGELGALDDTGAELGRRAAELLATAAQRALGRDDLAAAGASSARALALLPASDAAARADLLMMGCECLLATGDGAATRPLVEELVRTAADDPRLAAWGECYAAQFVGLTDPDGLVTADAQAQAAAEALTALDDGSGQAKAHQVRAGLLARLGRVGDAELELDLALAAARAADDRRRVTAVLGAAPDAALFGPSPVARAGGRCLDVVRLLRITTASPAVEAASNRCQAVLEALRGRFDVSRSMLASARASLEELGLHHGLAQTELYAGMVELIAGNPHGAIAPLRAAYEGLGTLGVGADAGQAAALLATALLAEGEVDEAELMAAESEALAGQNLKTAIGWRVARAEVLAARGDLAGAVAVAEEAVGIAAGTDLVIDHADACVALAALRGRAGDAAGARAARADAKRLYEQKGATVPAERLDDETPPVAAPAPSAPIPAPPGPEAARGPTIENTASRVYARTVEAIAAEADNELLELVAPEFRYDDRRRVVNFGESDLADAAKNLVHMREQGIELSGASTIAVRGDRRALSRSGAQSPNGDLDMALALVEVDEQGLLSSTITFEPDDLDTALEELDARYVADEGAEHTESVAFNAAWIRAFNAHDYDALRNLAAPDFVVVDHRLLGQSNLDLDGFIESFSSYADVRMSAFCASLRVRDRATLATTVNHAMDPDGGEVLWVNHAVSATNADGRIERAELFNEDDWGTALARFDELSTPDPRTSRVENAASRVWAEVLEAVAAGADDALARLVAPEFRLDDRVPLVGAGERDRYGTAEIVVLFRQQGYEMGVPVPIAVRGEGLALCRFGSTTPEGDETSSLSVVEVDDQRRLIAVAAFGEAHIARAVEEMEARYLAGEGAEDAEALRPMAEHLAAFHAGNWDALAESVRGYEIVDHRGLWPEAGPDSYVARMRSLAETAPDATIVARELHVRGDAALITADVRATGTQGDRHEYTFHAVGCPGRFEYFDESDLDAALARLEELGAGASVASGPVTVENAASRAMVQLLAHLEAQRLEEMGRLFAADVLLYDRRSIIGVDLVGRDALVGSFELAADLGPSRNVSCDSIAVRGSKLALAHSTQDYGDWTNTVLVLGELGADGLFARGAWFDADATDDAIELLDEWYIAGEGAEHAQLVSSTVAWSRAMNSFDFDAMRELAAPGYTYVDHRPLLGTPPLDIEGFIEWQAGYRGVENHAIVVDLQVRGRVDFVTVVNRAVDVNGGEIIWPFHVVGVVDADGLGVRTEVFAAEDRDAAFARFEELSAADPRTPQVQNAATRTSQRVVELVNAGRFDEALGAYRPDFQRIDHRGVVAAPPLQRGAVEYMEGFRAYLEVFDRLTVAELAVRGERLALNRSVVSSDDGLESVFLHVMELDDAGLIAWMAYFDEDDLDAALEELDARYLAGEGIDEYGRDLVAWMRALNRNDFDAMRELAAPGFAFVDRRQMGFSELSLDDFIAIAREYGSVRIQYLTTTLRAHRWATLSTQVNRGIDADGGEFEWRLAVVGVTAPDGRTASIELYDEEDWETALARFDEVTAESVDPRNPRVENAVTRRRVAWAELIRNGRFDEARARIGEFMSDEGVQRFDRRRTVAAPDADGAGVVDSLQAMYELGLVEVAADPIAVRGERLALYRQVFRSAGGDELVLLTLQESDATDRAAFLANYDETQLTDALAELDARYAAGEGAEHAHLLTTFTTGLRAMQSGDLATMSALASPDFDYVDRRPASFGALDTGAFLEMAGSYEDVARTSVVQKVYFGERTLIARLWTRGVSADGAEVEWVSHNVWVADEAGRARHGELFAEDDWDAALARFDELAATFVEPRNPRVENAASRSMEPWLALYRSGRFDEIRARVATGEFFAEDYQRVDRRPTVSAPDAGTRGVVDSVEALYDLGLVEQLYQPIAVRGDRLVLARQTFRTTDGTELEILNLAETNATGHWLFTANYDETQLSEALAELDDRYLEGEGAEHAEMIRRSGDFIRSMASLDGAATLALFHRDIRWTDHRMLGFGTMDYEGARSYLAARAEQVAEDRSYFRDLRLRGSTMMGSLWSAGIGPDGDVAVLYEFQFLARWVAGKMREVDWFDLDDVAAAEARFAALAAAPPPADLDNACVRALERLEWLAAFDDPAVALESIASDVVAVDHRRGVGREFQIVGRDAFVANQIETRVNLGFRSVRTEWLAIRGERHALAKRMWTTGDGFEVEQLETFELDDEGRLCRNDKHDLDDLDTALTVLDERYAAGEGAEHAELLRAFTASMRAMNSGDEAEMAALNSPDFEFVDHRLASWGTLSAREFVAMTRAFEDVARTGFLASVRFGERCLVARYRGRGVSAEGAEAEWPMCLVYETDTEGRGRRGEGFDGADWEAALARFDELGAVSTLDPRTPEIDNAATRAARLSWRLLAEGRFDELPAIAPGFALESRRRFLRLPVEEDWRDALVLLVEQYSSFAVEPLAVRGGRAAVVRIVAGDDSGNESPWIATLQLDESDRWLRQVNFDEEDEVAAIDLLDEWYIEGEGASDAAVLAAGRAGFREYHARDWSRFRERATPDFVFVDHRPLPWPTCDRDGYIQLMQERVAQVDVRNLVRKLFVQGRVFLSVSDAVGTDEHGGLQHWPLLVLHQRGAGGIGRIEYFAPEQFDAALARFDELAASPVDDVRTPEVVNGSTRTMKRLWAAAAEQRFDDIAAMLASGVERVDHRAGVAIAPVTGVAAYLELLRASFGRGEVERVTVTPVAVRGERLSLTQVVVDVQDFEIALLLVAEIDDTGRVAFVSLRDVEDLAEALVEIEDRFVAGEGAPHARTVALARRLADTSGEGMIELVASDALVVDHQRIGIGSGGRDLYVDWLRTGGESETVTIFPKLYVSGGAVIATAEERGDGTEWIYSTVISFDVYGRLRTIEWYGLDDWKAALARFDELAAEPTADPRHPRAENAVTRLLAHGRRQEDLDPDYDRASSFAPDVSLEDRRSGVSLPPLHGGDQMRENMVAQDESFGPTDFEPVAVRGDHLALVGTRSTSAAGFELTSLMVFETDDEARVRSLVSFDEDDLAAAIEELDARYIASGLATDAEVAGLGNIAALNRRDWEAFTASLSPDLVTIDHSPLGFAPAGRHEFVRNQMQGLVAVVPDAVVIPVKVIASGDTVLTSFHTVGTTEEGSRYEWTPVAVGHRGVDGLIDRSEFFQVEDWDAALARFDELAAESTREPASVIPPALENLATRRAAEFGARTNAGDSEGILALIAPGYEALDRRSVTFGPTTSGEEFLAAAADLVQVFDEIVTDEVLAIRGERLGVTRARFVSANGFEVAMIGVGEIDDDGRILATVLFDEDDLPGAMQELEDRYCAGEGASDAYTIRRIGDLVRARDRRDWDGLTGVMAPDLIAADHRLLPYPLSDRESYVVMQQGVVDLAPDVSLELRTLEVRSDAVLARVLSRGTSVNGALATWEFWNVCWFVAGRMGAIDWFDLDDEVQARARFEEFASADPRVPTIDNDAVRPMTRLLWTARFDFDRSIEMFSPDVVYTDRRAVIGLPTLTGIEAMGAVYTSTFAVYDDVVVEPTAVRGARLALFSLRMSTEDGSESVGRMLVGLDGEGRIDVMVAFDDDDLTSALEELERRHEELSGDTYSAVERTYARASTALARGDMEAWQSCLAPGVRALDHIPLGTGDLDGGGVLDHLTVWRDQTPDFVGYRARSFVQGDAMLSALAIRGTTPEGNRYEWDYATVARVDTTGLLAEEHFFPIEQWDAARALFDEWSAEPGVSTADVLSNRAVRNLVWFPEAFAARDWERITPLYHEQVANDDRRRGVSSGQTVGRDFTLTLIRSFADVGVATVEHAPVAIRGDRLALVRRLWRQEDGFEIPVLSLMGFDTDDRMVSNTMWDVEDLAAAVYELDRRYLDGEGAEHAWMIRPSMEFWRSYNARDWDGVRRGLAATLPTIDHRLASAGSMIQTPDQFLTYTQEMVALVPDMTAFDAEYLAIGRVWTLSRHTAMGTSTQGAEVEFAAVMLTDTRDGRFTRSEVFGPEQLAEALARFDELEADEPTAGTSALSNRATRAQDAYNAAFAALDWDAMAASYAAEIVNDDRRTGVSSGVTVGREQILELVRGLVEVGFTTVTTVPIAIRGEGLALLRRTWHQADGFDLPLLAVGEVDADGRTTTNVMFDAEDMSAAMAELERRSLTAEQP